MDEKNLFQKICAVAFLIFAIISCIATAQSLSLTLEMSIPTWLSFAIMFIFAFGLYLLTSYCFKLVIEAFDFDLYNEHRGRDVILGVLGVVLFWVVCSMPTNTHSLFYTKVVDKVVVAELDNQKNVLTSEANLLDADIYEEYNRKINIKKSEVEDLKNMFLAEINHTDRIGLGERAYNLLVDIEIACGKNPDGYFGNRNEATSRHTKQRNTSVTERRRIKDHYIPQINLLLQGYIDELIRERDDAILGRAEEKKLLLANIDKLIKTRDYLYHDDVAHQDRIKNSRKVLDFAYNNVKYKDKILDNVEVLIDAKAGHKDNNVESYKIYKTERLHSVFKLWGDYLSGKLRNLDFDMLYWIIISLIIDIAGLLFFAIAFKKTAY